MTPRVRFWLVVAALALFGRMFQTHVLWAEESLPLAAAQQMLAGHTLYRDIWFDKPPGLVWFYAGVLELAGHSGYGLRLIGAIYILLIALAGYGVARRLAGEAAGRWSAFFLAFFLTFYIHSAVVPLAADLLMVLPHLATFYFLVAGWPLAAGAAAGVAFQFNSKAVLVLIAAAGWEALGKEKHEARVKELSGAGSSGRGGAPGSVDETLHSREQTDRKGNVVDVYAWGRRAWSLTKLLAGFGMAAGAGLVVVGTSGGFLGYWQEVWRWGARYAGVPLTAHPLALGLERTLHYGGFHLALVVGAGLWFWRGAVGRERKRQMAWWLAVSLAGVVAGWRFFPRYYFQVLAPLAVAAGMGWAALAAGEAGALVGWAAWPAARRKAIAVAALAAMLAVPAIRFGRVNALLAMRRSFDWRDVAMDADSRRVAADVDRSSKPSDKIFVWGFRPEIYYYAQRIGASRFLESQPLTGVLADRHLQDSQVLWPAEAARNRMELAQCLREQPPAVIVDGLGPYNPALGMEKYPEMEAVLEGYRLAEVTRASRIYVRKGTAIRAGSNPSGRGA